jgi:hypothetical protein
MPASIDNFDAFDALSDEEFGALQSTLESIPPEMLESGDSDAIETAINERLVKEGIVTPDDFRARVIPAVILAARIVACLASSYVALRGLSTNQPPDQIAAAIASAVAGCVTGGGASAIKSVILRYRSQIARGLRAIGLAGLANALLAGS